MGDVHTVTKGDITVLRVAVALVERGERVLRPLSENERYDLALDRDGQLFRVQCKTGRYKDGAVVFNTCSSLAHRGGPARGYGGQIEAFGVYCPTLATTYLVPFEVVRGARVQYLRVDPMQGDRRNGARPTIWATEFRI